MSQIITVPFTDAFLPQVVDYVFRYYQTQQKDLARLCLVFGGRRPSLFIKRDLARRIGKAYVPPKFFTIDEWMAYVAYGEDVPRRGSELDHAFAIYQLAMSLCPWVCRGRESFAQFLPWAREILHFIEQLDLEDVPLDSLEFLKEHAQIGFSVPEDINTLLMHLSTLRQAYHQELERRSLAPRGYQYRQAALRAARCDLDRYDEILFCNFFYLHRTENIVLKNVYDRGRAVLFMQGDQRRWPALARIAKTFGVPILEGQKVKPTAFHLNMYEACDNHTQAGLVHEILQKIPDPESTVIVLPDGDFLSVLLAAVGGRFKEFNVSMGYPLTQSALYMLLTLCLQAQQRRKDGHYYSKDYLHVLHHPLVKNLPLGPDPGLAAWFITALQEALQGGILTDVSGRLFFDAEDILRDEKLLETVAQFALERGTSLSKEEIRRTARQLHQVFFGNFENLKTAFDLAMALQKFVDFMQAHSRLDKYPFHGRIALRMQEAADELRTCAFARENFEPRELFKVLQERLASQLVAFSGSPLRGLQILGLFETRSLNFKHVIVVDVNEGLLPNLNIYEPLIPRDVMIKLNLDRLELEEEIQRYGFMRLISAAHHVHLIYQQNADRGRSRFVEELIWEQERRLGAIGSVKIERGAFEVSVEKRPRLVPKTPAMVDFLKNFRYSPSSLYTYLQNPYAFYVQYVLGQKSKEDLLEDPESRHIGNFVHDLLQEAFGPWIGKKPVLDETFRRYFQKAYASRFAAAFGRAGRSDTFLMDTVLQFRLERFLALESRRCAQEVSRILHIERSFEDLIELPSGPLRLAYRVDRVDEMMDGSILILDYKTGGRGLKPRPLEQLEPAALTRAHLRDQVISFQMPLYVHYLRRQFPGREVNCALLYLRTMAKELFLAREEMPQAEARVSSYLKALDFIMAEIYNLKIPFVDDPVELK